VRPLRFLNWLWSKRTTVTGYLGVFLGVVELNADTVGQWVSAPKRGTFLLIIGMATAGIGHFNQLARRDDDGK